MKTHMDRLTDAESQPEFILVFELSVKVLKMVAANEKRLFKMTTSERIIVIRKLIKMRFIIRIIYKYKCNFFSFFYFLGNFNFRITHDMVTYVLKNKKQLNVFQFENLDIKNK